MMDPDKLIKLTTTLTLVAVLLLFSSKIIVWHFTGSVSLLAAAIDNMGDLFAGLIAFFTVRYAMQPADEKHKWGHSKAEPLTSLALGTLICGAAFFLLIETFGNISITHTIVMPWAVVGVMLFSIVLTGCLFTLQRWTVKRTDSSIIHADSIHYKMDFLLNIAVIATMGLQTFWSGFDLVFGFVIAGYILWHTIREIIIPAISQLMDAELTNHDQQKIIEIILSHSLVKGYHDLRTRRSGRDRFVQVHLDLDENLPLKEAHEIGDEVMHLIENLFHRIEVIVHLDPVGPYCSFIDGHRIVVNDEGETFYHHH